MTDANRNLKGVLLVAQLIKDLFAETVIRQTAAENLFAELVVRQTDTREIYAEFLPRAELTKDLKATFHVGQQRVNLKTLTLVNGFGNIITEATSKELDSGYIFGTKFTMGPNQSVGSKIVFWYSPDSVTNYARGAIYTVSGNRPGTLIKETSLSAALSGEGWKELSFVEKPIFAATTEYFLLVWVNRAPGAEVRYSIPDSSLRGFTKNMGAGSVGSFSSYDPMPGGSERTYLFSIYATYDPATDATKDLFAEFTVAQGSGDIFAKLLLRQQTGDLKATFTLPETEDLFAKFDVAQGSKDLYAQFETQATKNLFAKFTVNKDFLVDLFCVLELYRPYSDLFAQVYVVNKDTQELYSKFTVYNGGSEQLYAKALIAQPLTGDLDAEFIVRNSATSDVFAEFELQKTGDLKATVYITTDPNMPSYYPIINDGIIWWLNFLDLRGRGFIGWPTFERDTVDRRSGVDSLKVTSERTTTTLYPDKVKGFKEITFGWLYESFNLNDINLWPGKPSKGFKDLLAEFIVDMTSDFTLWFNFGQNANAVAIGTSWQTIAEFYWPVAPEAGDQLIFNFDAQIRSWLPGTEYYVEITFQPDGMAEQVLMPSGTNPNSGWFWDGLPSGIFPISINRLQSIYSAGPPNPWEQPWTVRVKMKSTQILDVMWQYSSFMWHGTRS